MAKKKQLPSPTKFSLQGLNTAFAKVRDRLDSVKQTDAVRQLRQDLTNAWAMTGCGQSMERDLT